MSPSFLFPHGSATGSVIVPASVIGAHSHLQHSSNLTRSLAGMFGAGIERELGMYVEEIGRGEMLGELLVVDVDARRLRDALQSLFVEGRVKGAERALERRDAHVHDREADVERVASSVHAPRKDARLG